MKKKLAIISTYDDLCGIAGYTKALVRHLSEFVEIQVFDLDQFLFRHDSRRGQALADQEIASIASQLKQFDHVNIQLEHGTFGKKQADIVRRVSQLIEAAPAITLTFHTINPPSKAFIPSLLTLDTLRRPVAKWNEVRQNIKQARLDQGIYTALRKAQRRKRVSVVVHTKRDARNLKLMERLDHVFAHPLSFYSPDEAQRIVGQARQDDLRGRFKLGPQDVLLGCFGFIGEYKGLDTALKALALLPANYHLAVFGGLHPNDIRPGMTKDKESFLNKLLLAVNAGHSMLDEAAEQGVQLTLDQPAYEKLATTPHPRNLGERVHFGGALDDEQFARAMAGCDLVLLPYLEVGQSSSGPMSIACDLGCHLIASRTKAFMQYARFHPQRFPMFDVGNHLELAQLIEQAGRDLQRRAWPQPYTTQSNCQMYLDAFGFA